MQIYFALQWGRVSSGLLQKQTHQYWSSGVLPFKMQGMAIFYRFWRDDGGSTCCSGWWTWKQTTLWLKRTNTPPSPAYRWVDFQNLFQCVMKVPRLLRVPPLLQYIICSILSIDHYQFFLKWKHMSVNCNSKVTAGSEAFWMFRMVNNTNQIIPSICSKRHHKN